MPAIKAIFKFIIDLFRYHKKKIFMVMVSALIFLVILFPYDDLSGLLTKQVSVISGDRVFLKFDEIGLNFVPPSLRLNNVRIDTLNAPSIELEQLLISPSWSKIMAFSLGGELVLKGLWGGDLKLRGDLEKFKGAYYLSLFGLDMERVRLEELAEFIVALLKVPIEISGQVQGRIEVSVDDPEFSKQPRGEFELTVENLSPPSSIPTSIGPILLPEIRFSQLGIKARLVDGQVIIDEGFFGQENEPISGKFKGAMGLHLGRLGSQVKFDPREYEIKIDLSVKKSMEKDLALFLSFINKFKKTTNSGSRYLFKLGASRFQSSPSLAPINKL